MIKFPYIALIMLAINGEEVEFHRFKKYPVPSDIRTWTAHLCSPWWVESPLPDRDCISSRPVLRDPNAKSVAFHIKPEDHVRLENRGLQPEFKV